MDETKGTEGAPPKVQSAEELLNIELVPGDSKKVTRIGATYQRLVDKIFHSHIRRNVENYVDDMGEDELALEADFGKARYFRMIGQMGYRIEREASKVEKWLLHVDGSSTTQDSGAGIVITSPYGEDLEFVVKFGFKASNNEVEYEVLVIGIRMTHEVEARHLVAYSYSQLIVKQDQAYYHTTPPQAKSPLEHTSDISNRRWRTPVIQWLEERYLLSNKWETSRLKREQTFLKKYTMVVVEHMLEHGDWLTKPYEPGYLKNNLKQWSTVPRGKPFTLVYGTQAIIPVELGVLFHRVLHFYEECEELLKENLDLIEELREKV
ncbi:hypothetical protein Sango_1578000 [Sesamum angolense]|uniref:RNase H type-1 domain-containing protein n=1 Tax=Sesamum angolense TaxID=2727404 RepID=A0AAE2BTP5_9LAMI|nr:hypothetical protein Sango_1578000 [Sesamum angolense]